MLPGLPIGLLVYANLVMHAGAGAFCRRAASAGADSVLAADLPLDSWSPFEQSCLGHGIAPILIAPPNARPARLAEIARRSREYVYVTSRPGVTGQGLPLRADAGPVIRRLREHRSAPPLVGFGITTPGDVRAALEMGGAGAIAGSALADEIARHGADPPRLLASLREAVSSMKAATRPG